MIGDPLVAAVPNTRNKRVMALLFCPVDRGVLGLCRVQQVIGVVLDHVVAYWVAIASLWPSFNIDIRHFQFLLPPVVKPGAMQPLPEVGWT